MTLSQPSSGNELIVAVTDYYSANGPYVISDTCGSIWHLAAAYPTTAYTAIFYAENITCLTSDRITATANRAGAFPIFTAVEYSGLATSQSLLAMASGNAAGATYASPPVTASGTGDLLFAVHHTNGSAKATFTPASPWKTVQLQSDGSNDEHQTQDRATTSPGSYVSNGNVPASLTVQSVIAVFKANDTNPPSTPSKVLATVISSRQINLSWSASTDSVGVAGYRVFRNGSQIATSTTVAYADTGLSASTAYSYAIAAYNSAGSVSAQSATATATTQAAVVPSVPIGLSATAISGSQINLSWNASTGPSGVAGYVVSRNGSQVAVSATTSYTDTGLSILATYTYTVMAFDAAGNRSAPSTAATATTLSPNLIPSGTWTMVPTNGFPEAVVGYDNLVYAQGVKKFLMWDNYHNMTSESNQAYLAYDFSTNRWDVAALGGDFNGPDLPGSGHPVGMLQYDPNLNVFINYCCFSGSQQYEAAQQVWQFDLAGLAGRNKQTPNRPGNTTEASAVFDTQDNVYVLFDRDRGTWIYNPVNNSFTKIIPNGTAPNTIPHSAGYFSSLSYDSANNNIYLFGGGLPGPLYTNDLYTYNVPSNTWTRLNPTGVLPSGRQFAGFAYDSTNNIFLMVGGQDVTGYLNDTWIYDPTANKWTQLKPGQAPALTPGSTTYQRLAYDPDDNVFVLTWPGSGGYAAGQPAGYGAVQTWFFRYAGTGNSVGYAGNPDFTPTAGSLNRHSNAWANEPVLASSGSTLFAGWIETGVPLASGDGAYPHPFVSQLAGSTWTGLGTTYTALDSEFGGYDEAHDPSMASVGGVAWVSWNKENNSGTLLPNNLYAKYWNGSSWVGGPVGAVTSGASDTASYSQLVAVGSTPYIAFLESDRSCFPYCNNVFVKQWTGSAWSLVGTGTLNRNSRSGSISPHASTVSMTSDGTHPYVAWTEFAASTTLQADSVPQVYVDEWNGSSWVPLGGSLNNAAANWADGVSIAYLNGQPYVTWTERSQTGNNQVFVATWNGKAWTPAGSGTLNRDTTTGWAETPSLVADPVGGNLYLAWTEQQSLGQKVQTYVDQYSNGAWSTLGGTLNADAVNGSAERISVAVLNGQPVVAWGEVKYGSLRNVYAAQWNGSIWVAP